MPSAQPGSGEVRPCRFPPTAPGVDRSLLRDDVYRRLRDAIVDGTFAPGEQLKDLELAAWLGVSRTPVREALLRLAHSGLVLAQPGRSTVVSPLDVREVRDARDVVAAMHELAVRESVPVLTEADLAAMRDANHRFAAAVESGDVESAVRVDDELHGVLVRICGNRGARHGARAVHAHGAPRGAVAVRVPPRPGIGHPARRADPALRRR